MQPFKIKKKIKTSTELLLGIYLTKLNEKERKEEEEVGRRQFQAWAEGKKRPHTPHPLSLLLPAAGAESERD